MRNSERQYSVVAKSLASGLTAGQASGSGCVTSGKCRPALGLSLVRVGAAKAAHLPRAPGRRGRGRAERVARRTANAANAVTGVSQE